MDLENFIKQTLVQISQGVESAAEELQKTGSSVVSPYGVHTKGDIKSWLEVPTAEKHAERKLKTGLYNVREVEFDIAITASQEKKEDIGGKVGASIKVLNASVGGKEEKISQNSDVSRIKFSLPVAFWGNLASKQNSS